MATEGSTNGLADGNGGDRGRGPNAEVGGSGRGLLNREDWERVGRALGLSPRELELVQHIFEGKKLVAIARDMALSLGTVKTYAQRIRQKLHVSDQRELALAVLGSHLQLAEAST